MFWLLLQLWETYRLDVELLPYWIIYDRCFNKYVSSDHYFLLISPSFKKIIFKSYSGKRQASKSRFCIGKFFTDVKEVEPYL